MAVSALLALALAAVSSATDGPPPTVTGDPVVGQTLTSSAAGDSGLYRWQRCDPAASTCVGGPANDPNWVDIPGATGHDAQAYTVAPADLGLFIRVLAKDTSLGTKFRASAPVGPVTAAPAPPPPVFAPQHGVQLVGDPVSGTVTYKPPGQDTFVPLDTTKPIPVGSVIDTRGGRVRLTAATGAFGNTTPDESIEFYDGLFKILQSAATDSIAIAKLIGKPSCGSKAAAGRARASGAQAVTAKRRGKRLWSSGRGSYGTAGRGGTGSVRGTTWLTKETCRGTFFKVSQEPGDHSIEVNAKGKKKPIILGPGDSYLAER